MTCLIAYSKFISCDVFVIDHFVVHFFFFFWLQAIANACKVQASFVSHLTESDMPDECEKHFTEDEELEQLINGQICFKVYPFSSGMISSLG